MSGNKHLFRHLLLAGTVLALGVVVIMIASASRSSAEIKVYHHPHRTWLGVSIRDLTEQIVKEKKLGIDEGAFVSEVVDDSPAEEAGIQEGDIIVKFDGRDIDDADDLVRAVRKTESGKTVEVVVNRDGKKVKLQATLEEKPRPRRAFRFRTRVLPIPRYFAGTQLAGMELQELNKQLGKYFGTPHGRGVLVTEVEEESAAAEAGFKAGDVIVKVEEERVKDIEDIWDGLEDVDEDDKAKFELIRRGKRLTLEVEVGELEDISLQRFQYWCPANNWSFAVPEIPAVPELLVPKALPVPEIPLDNLEGFREDMERLQKDMQHLMKELQEKFQKEVQNLRRRVPLITKT